MAQRSQEELQTQLAQLGWTIGHQEKYSRDEVIPLRQLATVTLREETPQSSDSQILSSPTSQTSTSCPALPAPAQKPDQSGKLNKPKLRKLTTIKSKKQIK